MSRGALCPDWPNLSALCGDDCGVPKGKKNVTDGVKPVTSASSALRDFAGNLDRLMKAHPKLKTPKDIAAHLAEAGGKSVSYKTIERWIALTNEPQIDTVEAVARVFGLEPWQILIPGLQAGEHPTFSRSIAVAAEAETA